MYYDNVIITVFLFTLHSDEGYDLCWNATFWGLKVETWKSELGPVSDAMAESAHKRQIVSEIKS